MITSNQARRWVRAWPDPKVKPAPNPHRVTFGKAVLYTEKGDSFHVA